MENKQGIPSTQTTVVNYYLHPDLLENFYFSQKQKKDVQTVPLDELNNILIGANSSFIFQNTTKSCQLRSESMKTPQNNNF
jgi:hypothetical protein